MSFSYNFVDKDPKNRYVFDAHLLQKIIPFLKYVLSDMLTSDVKTVTDLTFINI